MSRRCRILLILLLLLALAIRVTRALQQPIVNPDAIRFVDQAQQLAVDPLAAIRNEPYHPLHSVISLALHPIIAPLFRNSYGDRIAWLATLQFVGIIAGAILAIQIFFLARVFGAPRWASLIAGALWAINPRIADYGPDGLSDMLFLSLFAASLLVGIRANRLVNAPPRRLAVQWLLAGILAGLAFLTRPEGLFAPILLTILLITNVIISSRRRHLAPPSLLAHSQFRPFALSILSLLLGTILIAAPYILAIGSLTLKKTISLTQTAASATAEYPPQSLPHALAILFRQTVTTFGYAPSLLITIPLILSILFRHGWGRPRLRPLVICWYFSWLAIMLLLLLHSRYLDGRHTLILQLLFHALLALALVEWTKPMRAWMNFWRRRRPAWLALSSWMRWQKWPITFALSAATLSALPSILALQLPPTSEQKFVRQAAAWIDTHTPPNTVVYDRHLLVGYYANRLYLRLYDSDHLPVPAPDHPTIVALPYREGLGWVPPPMLQGFTKVASFSGEGHRPNALAIYQSP